MLHVSHPCPAHKPSIRVLFIGCAMFSVMQVAAAEKRCLMVELYYNGNAARSQLVTDSEAWFGKQQGVRLIRRNVQKDNNRTRWEAISKHYHLSSDRLPVAYALNTVVHAASQPGTFTEGLEQLTRIEVFVRTGCSRCAAAKEYLKTLAEGYPFIKLTYRDIQTDRDAANALQQLVLKHRQNAASVPVFHVAGQLVVGFDKFGSTDRRLRDILKPWTTSCPLSAVPTKHQSGLRSAAVTALAAVTSRAGWFWAAFTVTVSEQDNAEDPPSAANVAPKSQDDQAPLPPLPLPQLNEGAIPDASHDTGGSLSLEHALQEPPSIDVVHLPIFGELRVGEIGLPVLTIAIGLVDGFNPCAMWVLLILLSILVNLKSRSRILAVAGSFVLVSGLVYFAFMAAWLNVFLLVGYLRPIQIILACLAMVVGTIHMKDFFAFKRGISLSIPESAKPGLYARVRRIVTAENLTGAIVGAVTLAVLVNIVELLCTAGLPALYTEILTMHELAAWKNYSYLALYNAAYMFDDALMVGLVVVTLGRHKMQETQGRWLKMVSGFVIFALGLVLLVRPDWLA